MHLDWVRFLIHSFLEISQIVLKNSLKFLNILKPIINHNFKSIIGFWLIFIRLGLLLTKSVSLFIKSCNCQIQREIDNDTNDDATNNMFE